jgi:16S rRNA G966 N2-methylase RsmD
MIEKFLNVRNSLKSLSDEEFDSIVDQLAAELEKVSFLSSYDDRVLRKDWINLKKWNSSDYIINSTSRVGMKLCEHFFPNFYNIENNKGKSFYSMWNKKNLAKILRWNRNSHSTPYMSELKRGIYFCCGMTKNTMFRPQIAKLICLQYNPTIVLDPCAGWGGRLLGTVASGAKYIAFEPNTETFNNLNRMTKFLGIESKIQLICDSALNMVKYNLPKVDLVLTSPPYFDLEVYTHENTQSIINHNTYDDWKNNFFEPLMKLSLQHLSENGHSCWNVGKVGKNDMFKDVLDCHLSLGYNKVIEFSVQSSKRQSLQSSSKNNKSVDRTEVYSKLTHKVKKGLFDD